MEWTDYVINGVPIVALIVMLVQVAKGLGLSGKTALRGLAVGLGVAFGVLYQLTLGPPAGIVWWVEAVIFGVALGLAAFNLYDAAGDAIAGGLERRGFRLQ